MKKELFFIITLTVVLSAGCGQKTESTDVPASEQVSSASTAVSSAKKAVDPATTGVLKGKVIFEGQAPAPTTIPIRGNPECSIFHEGGAVPSEELLVSDGRIKDVFVYIKEGLEGYSFEVPQTSVEVDNKKCVYVPHVTGAQVGQSILILNSDPTLHNVHAMPKNSKSFNIGLPSAGMKQIRKFDAPEVMIPLKCDVHPWMKGYVGVLAHPYFQVTGQDGAFELKNIPSGTYTVEVWQEKLGTQQQSVTIGPQETKEIEFKYSA